MQPQKVEKGLTDINGCLVNYLENVLDKGSLLFQADLRSHFYDLDALTNGFAPANLIAIASRPGMGKSSFALTIAVNVTKHSNKSVVFFSLNKPKLKLLYRFIAQRAYFECN